MCLKCHFPSTLSRESTQPISYAPIERNDFYVCRVSNLLFSSSKLKAHRLRYDLHTKQKTTERIHIPVLSCDCLNGALNYCCFQRDGWALKKWIFCKISLSELSVCFLFQESRKGDNTMGLYKQYLRVGQYARNQLFGINNRNGGANVAPIQMLISEQGKINTSESFPEFQSRLTSDLLFLDKYKKKLHVTQLGNTIIIIAVLGMTAALSPKHFRPCPVKLLHFPSIISGSSETIFLTLTAP